MKAININKVTEEELNYLSYYMNDELKEKVHELAPCNPSEFLKRYCELDLEFREIMSIFYNINIYREE